MSGWISLHRQIQDHWIFDDDSKFKAWVTMLLEVNHTGTKVLIDGELIECNRGQSVLSLQNWAKKFGGNWTRQKVRTFFSLLENDSMINTEGLRKTTRLTICNYDSYQNSQPTDNPQITNRQPTDNQQITTNNNDNKENNDNNDNNLTPEKFQNFKNEEWLNQVQKVLKDANVNIELDYIRERSERYVNERLVSGDTNKSFHEYADHFRNTLKKEYKKGEIDKKHEERPHISYKPKKSIEEMIKSGEFKEVAKKYRLNK